MMHWRNCVERERGGKKILKRDETVKGSFYEKKTPASQKQKGITVDVMEAARATESEVNINTNQGFWKSKDSQ